MSDNLIQIYYVVVKLVGNSFRHDKLVRKVEDHNKEGVLGARTLQKIVDLSARGWTFRLWEIIVFPSTYKQICKLGGGGRRETVRTDRPSLCLCQPTQDCNAWQY